MSQAQVQLCLHAGATDQHTSLQGDVAANLTRGIAPPRAALEAPLSAGPPPSARAACGADGGFGMRGARVNVGTACPPNAANM